jgi:hypothetical protein
MTYGDTGAPSLWPFYSFHSAAPLLTQSHFYSGASTFPVTEMDATISLQNFDILSFDLPPFDCPLDGLHPVSSSSSLFDGDDTDFGPLPVNKFALLFENSILRLCKPLHCRLHDEVFELGLEEYPVIRASKIFIVFARLRFLELQAQRSSQIYLVCNLRDCV